MWDEILCGARQDQKKSLFIIIVIIGLVFAM